MVPRDVREGPPDWYVVRVGDGRWGPSGDVPAFDVGSGPRDCHGIGVYTGAAGGLGTFGWGGWGADSAVQIPIMATIASNALMDAERFGMTSSAHRVRARG
ncbi:hypothetical protein G6F57_021530 [Rhizopus arrhizus]|nr:hypothetical protein G6F57_021530 [Rhizopus arrhizus]